MTRRTSLLLALLLALSLLFSCGEIDNIFEIDAPSVPVSDIPVYSGDPYIHINDGVPFFDEGEYTTEVYEKYSPLDKLGRCGVVMACVGKETMPTGDRESISSIRPSGWHSVTYDCISTQYLYNRSHLIGWQLTGENANENNLITGTRYFNVTGMLPFENMVADYINETANHVIYRVTPVFIGDNLVAHGVLIEAFSVEDGGEGICFNVFVYNVQPDITIDYATGKSSYTPGFTNKGQTGTINGTPYTPPADDTPEVPSEPEVPTTDYVLNTDSKKIHLPSCRYAENMSAANRSDASLTEEEYEALLSDGYTECKTCIKP